jgi:hypothetical protein
MAAPDETENRCLMSGSEDLIIHDSEEEEPFSPPAGTRIDFGRFVYAAHSM